MIQHQRLERLLGKRLLQPADASDVLAPANVITLSHVILASAYASSLESLNSETQQRDLALITGDNMVLHSSTIKVENFHDQSAHVSDLNCLN
jgi:hypothetical protein